MVARQVRVELPEPRRDLGEGDPDRSARPRAYANALERGGRATASSARRAPAMLGLRTLRADACAAPPGRRSSAAGAVQAVSATGARRHRTRSRRVIVVALCVAACGTPSSRARARCRPQRVPATAGPHRGAVRAHGLPDRRRRSVRPGGGARREPRGVHRQTSSGSARPTRDGRLRAVRPGRRVPPKSPSPAFAINDTAWLESHIDPAATGEQAIVSEVNGTGPVPARGLEPRLRGQPRPQRRLLGRRRPGTSALIVRWHDDAGRAVRRAPERARSTGSTTSIRPARRPSRTTSSLQLDAARGSEHRSTSASTTRSPRSTTSKVRQAIAMGIDRQRIVDDVLPARFGVATHFTPVRDPVRLRRRPVVRVRPDPRPRSCSPTAGFPDGFDTTIQYRRRRRRYLPDPTGVATELQAQLLDQPRHPRRARGRARRRLPRRRRRRASSTASTCSARARPSRTSRAFLDPRFGAGASTRVRRPIRRYRQGPRGRAATTTEDEREAAYAKANDAIRAHVPMVPIARAGSTAAFRADVDGAVASPLRHERFAAMTPGDRASSSG